MSAYRLCDTDTEIVKIHKHVGVRMPCSLIWRNSVRKYKGKLIGYLPSYNATSTLYLPRLKGTLIMP